MKNMILLVLILVFFNTLRAQTHYDTLAAFSAGPGVEYTHIRAPEVPWEIHVLKINLKNPSLKMEVIKSGNVLNGNVELTSSMSTKNTYENHSVIGAVNADFFSNNNPIQMMVHEGQILHRQRTDGLYSSAAFNGAGQVEFASPIFSGSVTAKGGAKLAIDLVNEARQSNMTVLYNSMYGTSSRTDNSGSEAILRPLEGKWYVNDTVYCVIDSVAHLGGNLPISNKTNIVISSLGTAAAFIDASFHKGDTVKVFTKVTDKLPKLTELTGGHPFIMLNGAISPYIDLKDPMLYNRDPRSVVGYSKDTTYLYLVQVDGRQPGWSAGMNVWELIDYLKSLGVYQAMHLDSGGSATMVVRNQLMNNPSDGPGSERAVANSLMVVSTLKTEALSKVIIYPNKVSVFRTDKLKFKATGSDKNNNPASMNASQIQYSCDPLVGTIDNSGNFTSANLNTGKGYVYIKYNGLTDSAIVTFKPITKIELSPRNFVTDTLKTVSIKVKAYDSGNVLETIAMSDLKWSISDGTVGSVDLSSTFRGKKEGTAKLIADYSGIKDTIEVKVEVGKDTRLLSDMENASTWTISGENVDLKNTKLSVSNDIKSTGTGSIRVDYSFTYNSSNMNRVFLDVNPPIDVYGIPDTLSLDGRSDSAAHRIYIIVSDDNGEQFKAYSNMLMKSAGKFGRVTIPFKNLQQIDPGALFNYPVSLKRIQVDLGSGKVDGVTYTGTFYLDNLRARYPLQTTGVENAASPARPEGFALHQNYPNPFNPSTMIEFTTREFSHVSLKVYDVLGREAAVLLDKDIPGGSYKVNFNAGSLSSGVYFYRLESGSNVEIKKMILLR